MKRAQVALFYCHPFGYELGIGPLIINYLVIANAVQQSKVLNPGLPHCVRNDEEAIIRDHFKCVGNF